jgi:hypothetical protein
MRAWRIFLEAGLSFAVLLILSCSANEEPGGTAGSGKVYMSNGD